MQSASSKPDNVGNSRLRGNGHKQRYLNRIMFIRAPESVSVHTQWYTSFACISIYRYEFHSFLAALFTEFGTRTDKQVI